MPFPESFRVGSIPKGRGILLLAELSNSNQTCLNFFTEVYRSYCLSEWNKNTEDQTSKASSSLHKQEGQTHVDTIGNITQIPT